MASNALPLARHNFTLFFRDSAPMLTYLLMPILMMSALRPLYSRALGSGDVDQLAAGQAVMFSLFALGVAAAHIFRERYYRTLDRIRTTPTSGAEILLGKLAPLYVVLVTQQVVLLGYAVVVLGLDLGPNPLLVVIMILVWSATLLAAAAAVGLTVRTNGQLDAAKDLGAITLSTLGGALVPIALLPAAVEVAAYGSPAYWAISGFRNAFDGHVSAVASRLGVLLALAAVLGAYASWRINRGALRPTQ